MSFLALLVAYPPMNAFEERIDAVLASLGISKASILCPLQTETADLERLGEDIYGREQYATPATVRAWHALRNAAAGDNIELQIVSAFRSVDYQCGLIQRKLDRGEPIDDILAVNAPPGYSEHHSGRALDLHTPGCEVLEESFEQTDAFRWLTRHGADFGFSLSYPRDNDYGFSYEPWHWALAEPR